MSSKATTMTPGLSEEKDHTARFPPKTLQDAAADIDELQSRLLRMRRVAADTRNAIDSETPDSVGPDDISAVSDILGTLGEDLDGAIDLLRPYANIAEGMHSSRMFNRVYQKIRDALPIKGTKTGRFKSRKVK